MRYSLVLLFTATFVLVPSSSRAGPTPIEKLEFSAADLPRGAKPRGKIVAGLRWRDAKGENWLVMTRGERVKQRGADREPLRSAYIFARHSVRSGARLRRLRRVRDRLGRCDADLTLKFLPKTFGVTDLDGDGVAEVSFAYSLGCRSDVSPITLKVLLLEGGRKYILRGTTRVKVSDTEKIGGKLKVGRSFKRGPSAFLEHAKRLWQEVVDEF